MLQTVTASSLLSTANSQYFQSLWTTIQLKPHPHSVRGMGRAGKPPVILIWEQRPGLAPTTCQMRVKIYFGKENKPGQPLLAGH